MDQKKKGILMCAAVILSIGLLLGPQDTKAANGDLNAAGIVLKDTNANGKIDEAQITADYAGSTAIGISNAVDTAATISKFTVTDTISGNPISISSIAFVSGNGTVAVFKLVLNEADTDLNVNTSATALNIVYDATGSNLRITDGTTPANVAAIASSAVEKDGARPIIVTAVDQNANSLDGGVNIPATANIIINFSEGMDTTSLDTSSEWTISPDPGLWASPYWTNSNKTLTLTHANIFAAGNTETVALTAPLAITGNIAADKVLQNSPIASAINNPFSFTIAGIIDTSANASASWSTVSASPVVLIANGVNASTIIIVAKNSLGGVLDNKDVTISSSRGASDIIIPAATKTDASGIATFKVSSSTAGKAVITVKIGNVKINETASINFLPIGSDIGNPTAPNENSGVILYRVPGDNRVYVIKNKKKQWIKSPKEFEENGYNWKKIQEVSAELLAKYPDAEQLVSELMRAIGDFKVYHIKNGKKQWIKTAEEFNAAGYDWNNIQTVTPETLAAYSDEQLAEALVKIVNALNLRVRSANSTQSTVLDTVKKDETYTIVEKKNGWYKIKTKHGKTGWVSGKYAKEEKDNENED